MMSSQQLDALKRADHVRLTRAAIKQRLRTGELTLLEALEIPECGGARLGDLLRAQRRWGQVRVTKVLRAIDASPFVTVDRLSPRQVEALGRVLRVIRPTGEGVLSAVRGESPWVALQKSSAGDGPWAA
jgi:hypothetical protein